MNPTIIAAAIIAAVSFGSAWQIQSWRMDAKEKSYVEQALAAERSAAAKAIRNSEAVIVAQNQSAVRAAAIRRDGDAAVAGRDSLLDATNAALSESHTSHDACIDTSARLSNVFMECSRSYESVARSADLWQNDALTLRQAWPR